MYEKLRDEMKRSGISQEYLELQLHVSTSYVSKRLRGIVEWGVDEAYKVLDILRIPYSQLQEYFPPKHKEVRKFTNNKNKIKAEELQMKKENNEKVSVEQGKAGSINIAINIDNNNITVCISK